MEKKDIFFYLLFLGCLAYEAVNIPLLQLEIDNKRNTVEYQVLFQCMFFTVILGFIGGVELHRIAKRQCETEFKYIHKQQKSISEKDV